MKNNFIYKIIVLARKYIWLILIILLGLFLRLYRLDNLPAEMWGDTIEHYKLVQLLRNGEFFFEYRNAGDGPLISYLFLINSFIFGLSFYSLKLTTAIIGLFTIIAVFFLAKEIFLKKEIAYIAAFIYATGFWSLSFSRVAIAYGVLPLFVVVILYFLIKKKYIIAGLLIGVGMYLHVGAWGIILLSLNSFICLLSALFISAPLFYRAYNTPNFVFSRNSYVGEKFFGSLDLGIISFLKGLAINIYKNLIAFNFKGDGSFRFTIPGHSHLDLIIGIFFIIGWFFLIKLYFKNKDRRALNYLIISFFILQIQSIMDVKNKLSVPNIGRMIGVMPLAYLIAAYGIFKTAKRINKIIYQKYFIAIICLLILLNNYYLYFKVYPKTLPNNNTPFGRIIASKIDKYPQTTDVYIIKCCWGDWGQPEPYGIIFTLKNKNKNINFINNENQINMDVIKSLKNKGRSVLVITSPGNNLSSLDGVKKNEILIENNWQVARFIEY